MLLLAILFLVNIVLAALAVWAYRRVTRSREKQKTVQRKQQAATRMTLRDKQGYISIRPRASATKIPYQSGRHSGLQVAGGEHKAPWGW